MEIKHVSGGGYRPVVTPSEHKPPPAGGEEWKSNTAITTDRLELSQREQRLEQLSQAQERMASQLENDRAQAEVMSKAMKAMLLCQKIAARIMAGDKVPPADYQYLMEHDSEGYKLAVTLRKTKSDPEEWDQLSEKEEDAARQGGTDALPPTATAGGEAPADSPSLE